MSLRLEEHSAPSALDGLLERYGDKGPKASVEVACEHGEVFVFRQWADAEEPERIRREAHEFAVKAAEGIGLSPSVALVAPKGEKTLRHCYFLSVLSTAYFPPDPENKPLDQRAPLPPFTLRDWCSVATNVPSLFDTVRDALDERLSVIAVHRAAKGVEAAKKGSRQTTDGGSNSESAEASGESTPTNSPEPGGATT